MRWLSLPSGLLMSVLCERARARCAHQVICRREWKGKCVYIWLSLLAGFPGLAVKINLKVCKCARTKRRVVVDMTVSSVSWTFHVTRLAPGCSDGEALAERHNNRQSESELDLPAQEVYSEDALRRSMSNTSTTATRGFLERLWEICVILRAALN